MLISTWRKDSKTLELHYIEFHHKDDDGHPYTDNIWECRISDGRAIQFLSESIANMYIMQNMWSGTVDNK